MIDNKILEKLSNIRVLIVEDDKMSAEAIEQSLKYYCMEVFVAYDGMSGYEIFEKNDLDAVISDINLPDMSGLEMIKLIRNITPHIPVIIITSYDTSEHILGSIHIGAYQYIRKPFKTEDLQTALLMATRHIYDTQIVIEDDWIYNTKEKELYKNKEKITLTKSEKKLFNLLIMNHNKVIDYETIENYVWQDKSMSHEALRMCVKKIRAKTFSEIIQNVSGCGYSINIKKL